MEELYNKLQVLKQKNKDFKLFVYIIEFLELIIKYINPFAVAKDFNGDIDFTKIKDGDLFYVEQKEEFVEVYDIPVTYADKIQETEEYKNNPLREYINNDYAINYDRIFQENNIATDGNGISIDFNFLNDEDIIKRIHLINNDDNLCLIFYNDFLMNDSSIPKSDYNIKYDEGNTITYIINAVEFDFDLNKNNHLMLSSGLSYLICSRLFFIDNYYIRDDGTYGINIISRNFIEDFMTVDIAIIPLRLNTLGEYFNNEYYLVSLHGYNVFCLYENIILFILSPAYIRIMFYDKFDSLFSLLKMYILSNKYKYYLIYDQGNFRIINENPNIAYIRNKDLDELIKLFAEENEYIISKYDLNNRFHVNLNNGFINTIDSNKIYNYTPAMEINTFCKIKYLDENNVKLILDSGDSSMGDSYQLSQIFIGEFEN